MNTIKVVCRVTTLIAIFVGAQLAAAADFDPNAPAPERRKVEAPGGKVGGALSIYGKFPFKESRYGVARPTASSAIYVATGEYDRAIQEALERLKEFAPDERTDDPAWHWENGARFREHLLILANAYELKGEWVKALNVYAALYGDGAVGDESFEWAQARICYATGNREEAFRLFVELASRRSLSVVESALKKVDERDKQADAEERSRAERVQNGNIGAFHRPKPSDPLRSARGRGYDGEWLEVFWLKDECARFVCPELHYIIAESTDYDAYEKYVALRDETFERFLAFAEEEYAALSEKGQYYDKEKNRPQIELARKLAEFP